MKKIGCWFLFLFILASSFVFAEVTISEPLDVYNLGDRLYVNTDGLVGAEHGNLNINLVCGNQTTVLVKIPARAFSGEEAQSYSIPYKILNRDDLEISDLNQIIGECQVVASLGSSVASTKTFTITRDVNVVATLDKSSYDPGESITVDIEAIKENGALLNGFVEGNNASSFVKAIEDGVVSEIFSMPETIEAGTYSLNISAYDVSRGEILNKGSTVVFFDINQVASSVILSLSDVNVVPGNSLDVGAEIFDQSGKKMDGSISIEFISPDGEIVKDAVVNNDLISVDFESNSTPGIWNIVASFNDVSEIREFEILELQKVDFDFEDSVLSITNIGNTVYNKSISIDIGGEVMDLDLNIGVGEVRKFSVKAPNGEYEVIINDGENSISKQVLLTGNAVKISDLKEVGIFRGYSIIWIFLIIVLGGVGIILFVKYKKTKTITSEQNKSNSFFKKIGEKLRGKIPNNVRSHVDNSLNFTNKSPSVQGLDQDNYSHEDSTMVDLTKKNVMSAESTLVLKGEKYISTVIALSIKNYEKLSDLAKSALQKSVIGVHKKKGLIDWRGDYVFIVFSPIITKTYKNEALAAKEGMEILKNLNEYNKRFRDKIEFNIGIHVGELVASKTGEKLKYTSIGNTISLAKRIADSDNNKLIVSDDVRKKLMRDLKAVKSKEIAGNQTYEVSEVRDHLEDQAKLKDLLKRSE